MNRCPGCNTPAPWCWLGDSGRCNWLATPHWAAHNAARSPLGPPAAPPVPAEAEAEAEAIDPAEVARRRRAAKPRAEKGCKACHTPPPAPPPDPPG